MSKQIGLIFLIILLQSSIAILLQWGAEHSNEFKIAIFVLVLAIGLNGLRFIIWGLLHRKYDLSQTYPLSALFFPVIYTIAIYQGHADLVCNKIFGLALVFFGVFMLMRKGGAE